MPHHTKEHREARDKRAREYAAEKATQAGTVAVPERDPEIPFYFQASVGPTTEELNLQEARESGLIATPQPIPGPSFLDRLLQQGSFAIPGFPQAPDIAKEVVGSIPPGPLAAQAIEAVGTSVGLVTGRVTPEEAQKRADARMAEFTKSPLPGAVESFMFATPPSAAAGMAVLPAARMIMQFFRLIGAPVKAGLVVRPITGGTPTQRFIYNTVNIKLTQAVENAKAMGEAAATGKGVVLKERTAQAARTLEEVGGEPGFRAALGKLKGTLPRAEDVASIRKQFSDVEYNLILRQIEGNRSIPPLTKIDLGNALVDFIVSGKIPQRAQIIQLEAIYGPRFASAILAKRPLKSKLLEVAMDWWGLPRAVVSSVDLSAPLRQGVMLLPHKPVVFAKAIGPMFKAFAKAKHAKTVDDAIRNHDDFSLLETSRIHISPTGRTPGVTVSSLAREEAFGTSLAGKWPLIRHSERAYVTFLNKLRADNFYHTLGDWRRAGIKFNDVDLVELGNFINSATGRGRLGPFERYAPLLNNMFFAPRFAASRWQVLGSATAVNRSPLVRREAQRALMKYYGTGIAILSLIKATGAADVELDPRSTDFGKVRVGSTRYDFWGGQQTVARYFAQVLVGERKSADKQIRTIPRGKTIARAFRSKFHPGTALVTDIVLGETFIGDQMSLEPTSIGYQAFNRLTPFAIQDIIEAAMVEGIGLGGKPFRTQALVKAGMTTPLVMFGVNAVSYNTIPDLRREVAAGMQEFQGRDLDLNPLNDAEERRIDNHPILQYAIAKVRGKPIRIEPREAVSNAHRSLSDSKARYEADLRKVIDITVKQRGRPGGIVLIEAIRDMKHNRFIAGQVLFQNLENEPDEQKEDFFAELFWSTPLLVDEETGAPDYDAYYANQQEVLKKAISEGVDPTYITVEYREGRFQDDVVRGVVEDFEADMEALRPYWNMPDVLIHRDKISPVHNMEKVRLFWKWVDDNGIADNLRSDYRDYRTMPRMEAGIFLKTEDGANLAIALAVATILKQELRVVEADIDRLYIKWEYAEIPLNPEVFREAAQRLRTFFGEQPR